MHAITSRIALDCMHIHAMNKVLLWIHTGSLSSILAYDKIRLQLFDCQKVGIGYMLPSAICTFDICVSMRDIWHPGHLMTRYFLIPNIVSPDTVYTSNIVVTHS